MVKRFCFLYNITFAGYILSAVSILGLPFADIIDGGKVGVSSVVIAVLFWLGLIVGTTCLIILTKFRHTVRARIPGLNVRISKKFPGIMNFSLSVRHLVVYSVFIIGLSVIIFDLIFAFANRYLMFPVISVTYSAFIMHCMIDGKNYQIYKILKKGEKK